ncbi:MAG: hypothetical protein ACP5XB_13330 [Isosphaeraceae bacterium]
MSWWVYKCNNRNKDRVHGDWNTLWKNPRRHWGKSEWVPALDVLKKGDMIIAYQTERNEFFGLAKVRQSTERNGCLYLTPIERVGVKVRRLREDPAVASISAFRTGEVKAIYEISEGDVKVLLRAAGVTFPDQDDTTEDSESEEEGFLEGGARSAVATVRGDKLREEAKRGYGLTCYCCGFEFETVYGDIAVDRAIVHHLESFHGNRDRKRISTVEHVRVVCANCHYVIHLTKEPLDVDVLKTRLEKSWNRWSHDGVSRRRLH